MENAQADELQVSDAPGLSQPEIVARAGTYYRNARYLIVALVLGAGLWFAYDGFIGYPRRQQNYIHATKAQQANMEMPPNNLAVQLQRRLAFALLPLAPILLCFFLYRSRGVYRLSGDMLYVPGHPPVPLDSITTLDKSKWDRKGIARAEYQLPTGQSGRLTLDDFIYQREPTDKIVERIEMCLRAGQTNCELTESPPA